MTSKQKAQLRTTSKNFQYRYPNAAEEREFKKGWTCCMRCDNHARLISLPDEAGYCSVACLHADLSPR